MATTTAGTAISGITISNCVGSRNGVASSGVSGVHVINSYEFSNAVNGVTADMAANCRSEMTSGTGLNATYTATGCYGGSSSGTGFSTDLALNCYGISDTGMG